MLEISGSDMELLMQKFGNEYREKNYDEWKQINECFFNPFHVKYDLYNKDPMDAIIAFKNLLKELKTQFPDEYKIIHKGIPFFVIGASSFILKNYDQAIFYMDAAISEDKENHPELLFDSWAGKFFLMESEPFAKLYKKGVIYIDELKGCINRELSQFNNETGNDISIDDFKANFVREIINDKNTAILTTLYSFICEKDDVIEMISLRGEHGGSTEPMITHLLKGSLLFETLLRYIDNQKYENEANLGQIINKYCHNNFYEDYDCTNNQIKTFNDVINYIRQDQYQFPITAVCVTSKIRNLSAHNLNRDDNFIEYYERIYHQILNAIFDIIINEFF